MEQFGLMFNNLEILSSQETIELARFCEKNNISSEELLVAYNIAMGINPADVTSDAPREGVLQLADKIDQYTKAGLPLNKIATLISVRKEQENK